MTVLWLIFWLANHTPQVYMWNNWAIGLGVCLLINIGSAKKIL